MWYRDVDGGVEISIKVIAGAARDEIVGERGDFLVVKITAQREKGKANKALIKLLSKTFECSRKTIRIQRGQTQSRKEVFMPISLKVLETRISKKIPLC